MYILRKSNLSKTNFTIFEQNFNMNYIKINLLIAFIGLLLFSCEKEKAEDHNDTSSPTIQTHNDSTQTTSTQDTIQINNNVNIVQPRVDDYGEEYEPFTTNYVVANEVYVRAQPNKNAKKVKSLFFGDMVWVDYGDPIANYKKVFFSKPEVGKPEPAAYYIAESTLVDEYSFKEYQTNFALKPFSELHTGVKQLIMSNRYADNTNFELTQNSERAKDVIAYGDYDGDGINDVATLIDNVERQSSRLLIMCTNAATHQPYLAYSNTYVDKLKVKSFDKGAKIFMNNDYLEPSPIDGIILQGEDSKGALIYNKNTQKFEMYGQLRKGY